MSECVVCLENTESVYNIKDIACIKKTCRCEYFCHIDCVKDWIYENPTCLVCGTLMYVDDNVDLKYRFIRPVEDDIKVQMMPIAPYPATYSPNNTTHIRDNIHVNVNSYSPPPTYENVITSPISTEQHHAQEQQSAHEQHHAYEQQSAQEQHHVQEQHHAHEQQNAQEQHSVLTQNLSNIDNEIENSANEQLDIIQDECSMRLCCQYIACIGSIFCIIIISSNIFK